MSQFLDLVKKRQSNRKYTEQPVEKEKLLQCVEAARLAPSAHNIQPWKFIVVDNMELKNRVAESACDENKSFNKFSSQAPVIVVVTLEQPCSTSRSGRSIEDKEWPLIDIGIAVEHFCLQASELGLSTCMIGWFYEKLVKELLDIPEGKDVALMISVGYAPDYFGVKEKRRKSTDEVLSYNGY
ncbi:MAG: nitroreductase family protein [Bacteroidota bacterium]|nr:nitroreductase family protein [Bacteroidota bacterium]